MVIKKKSAKAEPIRPRVRRGNEDDAEQLRAELLTAASELFAQGGLDAVTVRAVASRVGISAMTPYRYFADKAELLSGLWQFVMQALYDRMILEVNQQTGGRARLLASIEAYVSYWEDHPDHYRLVYMTERGSESADKSAYANAPIYARILKLTYELTQGLATEIGAPATHVRVASDLRFAMTLGYLHAVLITKRYPWADEAGMRAIYIDQVMQVTERFLLEGGSASPGKNS